MPNENENQPQDLDDIFTLNEDTTILGEPDAQNDLPAPGAATDDSTESTLMTDSNPFDASVSTSIDTQGDDLADLLGAGGSDSSAASDSFGTNSLESDASASIDTQGDEFADLLGAGGSDSSAASSAFGDSSLESDGSNPFGFNDGFSSGDDLFSTTPESENAFGGELDAPIDAAAAATEALTEEATKGKKGKKAKKDKKEKPAKKTKAPKEPKAKKAKAPKEKSSYVSSPAPYYLLGTILTMFLAAVNALAYKERGADSYMFLIVFDVLGMIMLSVPAALLKRLRKHAISVFDMFLAITAIFSVAAVMMIFAYQAKTYGASAKAASVRPVVSETVVESYVC